MIFIMRVVIIIVYFYGHPILFELHFRLSATNLWFCKCTIPWNSRVEYPSRECKHDIKESKGNMFNPIFKENVQGWKHPGSCAFAEPEVSCNWLSLRHLVHCVYIPIWDILQGCFRLCDFSGPCDIYNCIRVNLIGIYWFQCWIRLQNEVVMISTTHYLTNWIVNAGQCCERSGATDWHGSHPSCCHFGWSLPSRFTAQWLMCILLSHFAFSINLWEHHAA